jgi:hypothetical protein
MNVSENEAPAIDRVCEKLGIYFGSEYEITTNNVDVFTIRSGLKPCVYLESEDVTIVNSIAAEFGLSIEKWRLVVAGGRVGFYFVIGDETAAGSGLKMVPALEVAEIGRARA